MDTFRDVFKWVLICTFFFMVLGFLYRWTSLSFSHDSLYVNELTGLEIIYSTIDNGRFLSPLYYLLRGGITAPFLIGVLGSFYLAVAITLMVRLFGVDNKLLILGLCGVLSVNACNTLINATYIKDFDCYMLALLLSVVCVVLCVRKSWLSKVLSVCALVASLALYQAFVQVALVLMLLYLVKLVLDGTQVKVVLIQAAQMLAVLAFAALGYMVCYKGVQWVFQYSPASSYNSLNNMGSALFGGELLSLVGEAYLSSFAYPLSPETYAMLLAGVLNALALISIPAVLCLIAKRKRLGIGSIGLAVLFLALMPLAASCASVFGNGLRTGLTIYSFNLLYLIVATLISSLILRTSFHEYDSSGYGALKSGAIAEVSQLVLSAICIVVVGSNVIYANQVSLKKDLEFESTYSAMTRIVDEIDRTEGYVVGQTPVALFGRLDQNTFMTGIRTGYPPEGLPDDSMYATGLRSEMAVTGLFSYGYYFKNVMAYPIRLTDLEPYLENPAYDEAIDAMPVFPQAGYCKMVDGVVFVRLSEEY